MNDETQDVQAILKRIDTLERRNRWLIRAGLVGSLVAVAIVTMGQARPSRTVEAERFVLMDAGGKMRGRFVMEEEGPALRLYDSDGAPELSLGVDSTAYGPDSTAYGPYLLMSNVNAHLNSKARFTMHLTAAGEPSLELKDETGYSVLLGISQVFTRRTGDVQTSSAASLRLFDKNGKVIWSVP